MNETKEWTLMFYFASDNPLAISVVSQLKAIKAAGFHQQANVVAQFDPYTPGTPTHVFDVNLVNKLKARKARRESDIGFHGSDPFVRTLIEDKLWRDQSTRPGNNGTRSLPIREALKKVLAAKHGIDYDPPLAPDEQNGAKGEVAAESDEPDPETSLRSFLNFCRREYPARHYMLFLLGHGVVVGNDVFMLDEHATKQALTLTQLRGILGDFKLDIGAGASFELVSFHSCSVSSLEVAYELKDTAKFMLASQGPAFVGSWPYRQILIRIFNDLVEYGSNINVREMLVKIFEYTMFNSADFLLAGYSFQLTLCDLTKVKDLTEPIKRLSTALLRGLKEPLNSDPNSRDALTRDLILLSHWKAQSFYNEMFTDLYDFCFCFTNKVDDYINRGGIELSDRVREIYDACNALMDMLVKENPKRKGEPGKEQILVAADSNGPAYQYSRGLSVYFPWSEPPADSRIMVEYEKYKFHTEFGDESWLTFLRGYFEETMREVSQNESDRRRFLPRLGIKAEIEQTLDEDIASLVYANEGTLDSTVALTGPKGDPMDKTGFEFDGLSVKNYPRDIRARSVRKNAANKFPVTESIGVLEQAV